MQTAAETLNCDAYRRRVCCVSPRRRSGRHPTITVSLLIPLLMMSYCSCIPATAAAAGHRSGTVAMAADDASGVWTPPSSSSLSSLAVSDRQLENVGRRQQLASFPRRDGTSSGRVDRRPHGPARTLIAGGWPAEWGRADALARHPVVNNATTAATKTTTAGVIQPSTDAAKTGVNTTAPVITSSLGRALDRPPRMKIKLKPFSTGSRRSSFSVNFRHRHFDTSFHRPDNSPARALSSFTVNSAAGNSAGRLSSDMIRVQTYLSTTPGRNDSGSRYSVKSDDANDVRTFSDTFERVTGLKPGVRRVLRRNKRERDVKSPDGVYREVLRPSSDSQLTTMSTDGTSTETSTVLQRTEDADVQMDVALSAAALRYRSRAGNFAALVDPLENGVRASASVGSSANKWRHAATADNSTSPPPPTKEPTSSSSVTGSQISILTDDTDSVEINVLFLHVVANDSAAANVTDSVLITAQPLNDGLAPYVSEAVNSSTSAPSSKRNCSKSMKSFNLQAALKLQLSASSVALCVYLLSFLFTLVSTWSLTSVVFSLCVHNRRSDSLPAVVQRSYLRLVLGLVAMAAAARALYYVAAEYQLLAAVAPPGGQRTIYECWFPFILAAVVVYQRLLCAEPATKDDKKDDEGALPKRGRQNVLLFRCESCAVSLVLCFCMALVVLLCLLAELCIVPDEAAFVLCFSFALIAVPANVYAIAMSSARRRISTQVVFCALLVVCVGFSAADAATFLSSGLALLLRQNSAVLIAVEGARSVTELLISALLSVHASSTIFTFQREEGSKNVNVGLKKIRTQVGGTKMVNNRQASTLPTNSPTARQSWLHRLLDAVSKKSKVIDVSSTAPQISMSPVQPVCWTLTKNHPCTRVVESLTPPPVSSGVKRSRSMLYNDHGFLRFRLDGDTTDAESDERTLNDDDAGPPEQVPVQLLSRN